MLFRLVLLTALLASVSPVHAQQQPRSLDTITFGPWEAVAWGDKGHVQFCTLIRTPSSDPTYGLLVDQKGTLFSIDTSVWNLPNAPVVEAGVAAVAGRARVLQAVPVSRRRANIDLTNHPDLVAELQQSKEVEVSITGIVVRLAFDGYSAARPVQEACVQYLGKELPRQR